MSKTRDLANLADLNFDSGTMVVDKANDRVGVGTSSPSQKLHISGGSSTARMRFTDTAYSQSYNIGIDGSAFYIYDITDNAERMRIDSDGRVGIGISNPVSKLDLASGNITISNSTNTPYINFVDNTTRSQSLSRITMDQVSGTAGQLLFSTTTGGTLSEAMRIESDGTLQLAGYASGANTLDASITAFNYGQSQVNSRIDFMTDTYQNSGQIKLRTAFGATTKDGIIVDEQARVTMPYQPMFSAGRNAGHVAKNNVYIFNSASVNVGSHYNTTNGRFTAPVAGNYLFSTRLMTETNGGTAGHISYDIRKNGSIFAQVYTYRDTAGSHRAIAATQIVYLAVNDYVDVYVNNSYTTSGLWYGNDTLYSNFSGYLLG